MISANLMGGLGNQMFQIAHAVAQGLKHNREVVFFPNSFTPLQGKTTQNYVKNIFRNINFSTNLPQFKTLNVSEWEYKEVVPYEENTLFHGYFQSSKNFKEYKKEIVELFSPNQLFINKALDKYPHIFEKNTVSIHARFGDYKKNPNIHPSVTMSYISTALDTLETYGHAFLFSDDKKWLKNNFRGNKVTIVDEDDYAEIWLMSLCNHNIICNSTFSWWGSFLNKHVDKKVFAPSIWFGPDGPKNYGDIFEPNWNIIKTEYINGELVYVI